VDQPSISLNEGNGWRQALNPFPRKGAWEVDGKLIDFGLGCDHVACGESSGNFRAELREYYETPPSDPAAGASAFASRPLTGAIRIEFPYFGDKDCRYKKTLTVTVERGVGGDKQRRVSNAELLLPDGELLMGGSLAVVQVKSSSHDSVGSKSERVSFDVTALAAEAGNERCSNLAVHDGSASIWRYGSSKTLANGQSYVVTVGPGGQLAAQRVVPREHAEDALLANAARRRALNPGWRCASSPF
jgi:hypothetical protein